MRHVSLIALLVCAQAASASQPLELKGLRIGQDASEVKAANPGAVCKTLAEGLEACEQADTLNSQAAQLTLYFMDGALMSASFARLETRHGKAIAELFSAKFGPPSFTNIRNEMHYGTREWERLPSPVWERDGHQLQVLPFALQDRKGGNSYTTVRLVDGIRWDKEWLPRLRDAEARAKVPAAKLKDADI